MKTQSLQTLLRTLSETAVAVSDADLLVRFRTGDESAFPELVKRHGRLVWAVCRSQFVCEAEAEDAFQATFLVLLKNAGKVREAAKISAWLHGVAYKVCAKSRQGAKRRTAREQATAHRDGHGTSVPDSAWDRALAAVHDEVAQLPENLRVPFVLCCLEGQGVSEAAAQLGVKLGTFSSRLTRAKDAVLAKLDARGLTLAVVAGIGLTLPPKAVLAKATALAQVGVIVPGSILQLSQGVLGMSFKSVKMLAATVLLACGFGLSVGSGWIASADAQQPAPQKQKMDAEAEVKRLQAELDRARAMAEQAAKQYQDAREQAEVERKRAVDQREVTNRLLMTETFNQAKPDTKPKVAFKTTKWEYEMVDIAKTFNADTFGSFLQERENAGWEFLGSTTLGSSGGVFQWLFRRPIKVASNSISNQSRDELLKRYTADLYYRVDPTKPATAVESSRPGSVAKIANESAVIEAEIKRLTEKLAEVKKAKPEQLTFDKATSPIDPALLAGVLGELGKKKFAGGKNFNVSHVNGITTVYGDKEVLEWAAVVVKGLAGK